MLKFVKPDTAIKLVFDASSQSLNQEEQQLFKMESE